MEKSRTKNSIINISSGFISQILTTILKFITQTIFIKFLGSEYLGLNGLFTNILTMLSFAELGIGNAIIFSMYKEIADENIEKIKSLMQFYKRIYTRIGLVVFGIGILIIPFLKYIIGEITDIKENIYIVYILFLSNTSISYFFTYKKSIIQAHQKSFIVDLCKLVTEVLKTTLQVIIIYLYKNYILYLIIQIFCTILDNLLASYQANKLFKYLKDKNINKISKDETDSIFKNVKSLILYKFGSVILNGTDNIIISKLLGLTTVGIMSNFTLLINTINTVVGNALNGFTASIGNLNANNEVEKQKKIFNQLFLLCVWIYGFCSIAFLCLVNNFITLWVGNEYTLSVISVFAIVLQFYVNGTQFAGYSYRTTLGLFEKGKYCPIIAATINIILSIILGYKMGLTGIILATSISRLSTTTWYDIYIVFKTKFGQKPFEFYKTYIRYFIYVLCVGIITYNVVNLIEFTNVISFILQMVIVSILPNILFLALFFKTQEFQEIYARFRNMIKK